VAINSGLGNNLASASRINRPNSGVGGNNIIIASGIGGGIYGGYGGYGGYPGYTGFNPYLSGYPFTSSVLPLDYAYTPYAGPTYIDPNLNNVRGYPPTNSLYSTPAPRLYPGGAVNPANPIPEVGPAPRAATATLEVSVPTLETELWFNGVKTQTQGLKREFVTPELVPGQSYAYELRARFVLNGKEYDQTRIITLHAGSQMVISISSDSREQLAIPAGIKI
jgi:uncharacterized protein (TIGR03000 family)